jgi:diadenosine tetraphosphate (Ap4A) HIT family hydrolase
MKKTKAQARTAETENTGCIFCALRDGPSVILRNELTFAIRDTTPVTAMHTLVLPYRHAETYFDLTEPELAAANDLLRCLRSEILDADPLVKGFNVGANVGGASGQTIFHCHIHLIPRRDGDVPEPRGGVRAVIPEKMRY